MLAAVEPGNTKVQRVAALDNLAAQIRRYVPPESSELACAKLDQRCVELASSSDSDAEVICACLTVLSAIYGRGYSDTELVGAHVLDVLAMAFQRGDEVAPERLLSAGEVLTFLCCTNGAELAAVFESGALMAALQLVNKGCCEDQVDTAVLQIVAEAVSACLRCASDEQAALLIEWGGHTVLEHHVLRVAGALTRGDTLRDDTAKHEMLNALQRTLLALLALQSETLAERGTKAPPLSAECLCALQELRTKAAAGDIEDDVHRHMKDMVGMIGCLVAE